MSTTPSPVSLHEQLRGELLSGSYAPGEPLRMAVLCERYGVSLSVVREALTRLAEQRLVRAEHNRGFAAIQLDLAEMEDLTVARVQVDTTCLRRSIAQGDLAWESGIVAAHYRLMKTSRIHVADDRDSARDWAEAHSAFHAALCAACASPRLLDIRQQLYDATEIYRAWLSERSGSARKDTDEHTQLMDVVLARDEERACELASAHIVETFDEMLERGKAILGAPEKRARAERAPSDRASSKPAKGSAPPRKSRRGPAGR